MHPSLQNHAKSAASIQRMVAEPRNVWSRVLAASELAGTGAVYSASQVLEGMKYHPELPDELLTMFRGRFIEPHTKGLKVNLPADYLATDLGVMHKPFRTVYASSKFPSPYPYGMALPPFPGVRNDHAFLRDTATQTQGQPIKRIHVIWSPQKCKSAATFLDRLDHQGFEGDVTLTVMTGGGSLSGLEVTSGHEILDCVLLSPEGQKRVMRAAQETDLILFLTGDVYLDECALQRAAFLARTTDMAVQPFIPMAKTHNADTPFSQADFNKVFSSRYPFRDVAGMNLAISPMLLQRIGPPNSRFEDTFFAAREFMYRAFNAGAYFAPVGVPKLNGFQAPKSAEADTALYQQLCAEHWERKEDGIFEVPMVSVYIPVYNASKYIERAVDSVLNQDVQDLELCLHDDGSMDHTLEVLKGRYSNEPRVRWQTNANGGIGFASNQAIHMSQAMYIGQLDSDDCLKPGAVRRLMEHMDQNPDLACCYASCERIDRDGNYTQDEYSWPVFSREKMMITSIAHHFRMFRRAAWERTTKFREDIVNAVDYDIFLKMSEVGPFHHIDEKFYQRRWHGENTSNVNEGFQTTNTYRVQREALSRLGLERYWDVHVPNPDQPRKVTYRRAADKPIVFFWPHYRSNPYQRLLYAKAESRAEFVAGKLEAALRFLESGDQPGDVIFHLHWLNFLFVDVTDPVEARSRVDDFLIKILQFKSRGGRLVWTIHNTLSHDMPFVDYERDLSVRLTALADVLHFHSEASITEVEEAFPIPRAKVRICPHGAYVGAYPDFVRPSQARRLLGLQKSDEVVLFTGQIRPYKGVENLVSVMRRILKDRPKAILLVAGKASFDLPASIEPALTEEEKNRIRVVDRFLEDGELQLYFRAADLAVYPYQKILTSGSMLLALSYGVPVVIPRVGMTAEVLDDAGAGVTYDGNGGDAALEKVLQELLAGKDKGVLDTMGKNARALAESLQWQDFGEVLAH